MSWTLSAFADEAGTTTQEQIAALKRAGIHYIDPRAVAGHNVSVVPLDIAREVKAALDAAGIGVNMLGSPLGKIDIIDDFSTETAKLDHLAEVGKIFECSDVRIFSYYNKSGKPYAQWEAESVSRLSRLRDQAEKLGLVLFHENESGIFGDRIEQNVVLKDKLRDGKVFKLIFDFDNFNRSGDDVWENWLKLRESVDAFHLKDSDKTGQHVPIGTGNGKAPEILKDAAARGWTGPLSLEPHLRHSQAVLATHVSGRANESFKDRSAADCFQIAAEAALKLLGEVGVQVK